MTVDQMRERWRRFFMTEHRWRKEAEAKLRRSDMLLRSTERMLTTLIDAVLDLSGDEAQRVAERLREQLTDERLLKR